MDALDGLVHIAIGIGLSAAAGFRILVPFLVLSLAAQYDYLPLAPDMAWIGTEMALIALAVATVLEILVYFIPIVDNLMDAVELPAATLAGVMLTAAVTGDMDPFLRWSLAIIAGGTIAGSTQALTSLTRLASTAVGGPVGNIAVSSVELASSTVLSVMAVVVPLLSLALVGCLIWLLYRRRRPSS